MPTSVDIALSLGALKKNARRNEHANVWVPKALIKRLAAAVWGGAEKERTPNGVGMLVTAIVTEWLDANASRLQKEQDQGCRVQRRRYP